MSPKQKTTSRQGADAEAADDIAGFIAGDETDEEDDCSSRSRKPRPRQASDLPFTAIDWTAHAGDADGMVGAEVIQTLVKRLPNAPGVYRMMNAAGDVLYVGKARSLKKRVTNYAQGPLPHQPHRPDGARDRDDGVRRHPHRDRGAAARSQSYQALAAALQCADAGRQVVSLYRAHRRPSVARHLQASRRALAQGRLFRPVRLGRRGRPHDQLAAAGVPAPHLHGFGVREPHAALPALPDQALLRPLHRRDLRCRTMPNWSRRRRTSCPAAARR